MFAHAKISAWQIVSFTTSAGETYSHVTAATLFEGVRNGMRWFADPYWKGPKPNLETVFTVTLVGDTRSWKVRGRTTLQKLGVTP